MILVYRPRRPRNTRIAILTLTVPSHPDEAMHRWQRSGVVRQNMVHFTCLSPSGACDSRLRILINIGIYAICTFHSCSVLAGFADNASVPTLTFHLGSSPYRPSTSKATVGISLVIYAGVQSVDMSTAQG